MQPRREGSPLGRRSGSVRSEPAKVRAQDQGSFKGSSKGIHKDSFKGIHKAIRVHLKGSMWAWGFKVLGFRVETPGWFTA